MKVVYEKLPHLHYESKIPLITCMDLNIQNNVRKVKIVQVYLVFLEEIKFLDHPKY